MENYKNSAVKRFLSIMIIVAMVLSLCTPFSAVFAQEENTTEITRTLEAPENEKMASATQSKEAEKKTFDPMAESGKRDIFITGNKVLAQKKKPYRYLTEIYIQDRGTGSNLFVNQQISVSPELPAGEDFQWSSSDENIASVQGNAVYGKQGAQGTAVLTATYEGSEGSINVNVQPKAEVSAKVQALAATLPQDSKDFKVKDIATYREFLGWYMSFKSNEVKSLNLPDFIKDQRSDYCLALANMINPYDGIDGFLRAEQGVEKIAQTVAIYPEAIKTQLNALQTKIADYKTQTTGDTMNQAELETAKDAIQGDSVAIVSAILKTLPSVDTADVAHEEQFLTAKVAYNALTSDDYRSKVDVDAVKNMKDGIAKIEAIKATVHADSVVLDKTEIGFRKTETTQLTATVLPEKTTDKTVIWSSENSAIATVSDKGLVTGIENGTTTITAQTENGKKATCIVSVIGDLAPVESVNINQTEATLKVGHDVTLTATIKPSNAVIKAATWTSSNAEIATVNSETGRVIAQKEGVTTITATADNKTATCQVTVTPRPQKEEATVYFKYDDGRIQDMDADKTFTLTMSDGGNFVLEGSDKTPWWQCIEEYKDGETVTKRDIWIAAGSGAYNPYSAKTMDATVVDEATCENNNPSVLANFKIKTVHAEIEALQLFVNDKAVEDTLTVQGSEVQMLTVKARLKGQTNFEFIPNRAIYITKNNGDVTMGTGSAVGRFSFTKPGTVDLSVVSKDNGMSKNLKVTSEYVKVEKIISPEPARIFEIDSWNALGGYYVGMTEPAFTVLPENASDKSVTWTEHTPDIAINMVDMFANGLVPKKNGLARFTVTSNDDKTINHTFEIDYRYKNPVKSVSIDQKEINAPFNDTVNLSLNFSPTNATEQRFDWTYDQNGIVEIKDQVVTKPSDSVGRETVHTMRTLKEGTVTVTGTPWDTSSGAQAISFKVNVSKGGSGQIADVKKMTKDGIASGQQFVNTVDNNAYGAEWNIFAMARSGGDVGKGNVEAWYDDVVSKTQAGTYFSNPTDIARVALAINASGRDAMNVGGINLIEKLYNYPNLSNATSNAMAFALITMDSKNYTLPSDAACSREKMIDELLLYQKDNGGFGLNKEGQTVSIDMTAMILQSLSTYNDDTHPKVKAAAEKGLTYLKNNMTGECGFIDSGSENSNSTAQVLTALTSLKIDPTKEENGFTRSNKNIITNLDSYKVTTGGFKYKSTDPNTKANGMATQQVLYALESYQRLMDGTNKLYDLTDVGSVTPPPVENPDQKVAQVVTDQINALGEITYAKKSEVQAARTAYKRLTKSQKAYVTEDTLKILTDAEAKIKELRPAMGTITIDVERFTISQGYFKEPVNVTFYDGETGMDILKRVIGEENFMGSQGYLSAIKGANLGTDQVKIPDYIVSVLEGPDTAAAKEDNNQKYGDQTTLGEFSYSPQSGWYYFVNNEAMNYGMDNYEPKQDDVMRVQFTYWGLGSDLSGTLYGDSEQTVKIANKDSITKALAAVNSADNKDALLADAKVQAAYTLAKETASNMIADQITTDETAKALNDAVSGFGKAPSVYFEYEDGRIQEMDKDQSFTLTMSDVGKFVLKNSEATPYWKCIDDHGISKDIWIAAYSGIYNPYSVNKTMDAVVIDDATAYDEKPTILARFKIKAVPAEIENLKLFVNDKEVGDDLTIQGSEVQMLTVKGQLKGQTDFVTLPSRAVTITKDNDDVSMGTGSSAGRFYFKKPGTATISVVSKDNGKTKDLKVTSNYVKVERIESTDIKTFDIDGWNNSEECYKGLAADKTYTVLPENASNKEVTWIDKTPEVATKIDGTFSKGLVPKKNGQADFIVTSVDNSAINHTVSINFKYKNPAKTVSADPNEITVEANASVPLKLTFEPDNATEQRFNWTYDQDGIVEVKDKIVSDFFGKTTEHTLRAIKEGTVTVTGTPWDTSGSAQKVTFKVTVSKGSGEVVDVKKMTKEGITSGQQFINTLGNNAYEAEWNIFAMARSGGDIGEGNIESWYDDVVSKTQAGTYLNNPIDIARVVLAVNASGRDATNIGGINLIEKLYNAPNLLNETSNAICFALISIDTKNYTLPNDALYTREKIIEELLLFQKESGGFGLSKEGTIATVDMTAMILQSLSTYNDDAHPKVQAAIEKGLTYLKNNMTDECGFMTNNSENSNSSAQVLTALTSLKIDPIKEENGFTRGYKNIITNLDSYKVATGGFKFKMTDPNTKVNEMSTQQALYALESYQRLMDGTNKLYDLTDVGSVTPPPVENPDQKAAQVVIDQINALGEITYAKKEAVEAARAAYDALNDKQKTWVTADTLKVLADAEAKIKELTPETRTITVSVERFTIGQGYFKEPVKVAFHEGESGMDIFKRIVGEENVEYSNGYFSAIKGANLGTDQVQIPDYIVQALGGPDTDAAKLEDNAKYENKTTLGQGSYTDQSGWLYFTNNTSPSVGMDAYQPKQDDVMRVQFSYWGWGADLTGLVYGDSEPKVAIANKDTLTKALAEVNSAINKEALLADETVQIAYAQAKEIATNMTADQATTDETAKALNDAVANFGKVDPDQEAAQVVTDQIRALGEITYAKKSAVEAARVAYDALSDKQKTWVTADTLKILTDAEVRIKELTPEIKPEPSPNPNPNPTPNPTPEITKPETEKTPDSVKPKNTVNAVGDNSKTGIIEDEQTSAMTAVGLLVLIGLAGTVVMRTKKKNEAH